MSSSLVIALEGPSCAGKSALADQLRVHLAGQICILPDYVEFAGGDDHVPPAPALSIEKEIADFVFFLGLDEARFECAVPEARYCVLDRSIHTLLAHRFAAEQIGMASAYKVCKNLALQSQTLVWPEAVIYLDVNQLVLDERYKLRPADLNSEDAAKSIAFLRRRDYNEMFRQYFFEEVLRTPPMVHVIDGTSAPSSVLAQALRSIEGMAR